MLDYYKKLAELNLMLDYKNDVYLRDDFSLAYFKLRDELIQDREELNNAIEILDSIEGKVNLRDNVFDAYFKLRDELNRSKEETYNVEDYLRKILDTFLEADNG